MKSFIGWIGGKNHLKKHIIPLIPAACDRYIEVCGGAGWVLFGKQLQKGQMEVFNDIDSDLVNLYRQIKYNCEELQKEVDWLQSRELFNSYRQEFQNNLSLSDLQRAARYLYLIRCSFGCNRKSFSTRPSRVFNVIDILPEYQQRLKDVIIENRDFESLINTYDRPSALFYVDPPYVGSEQYYNKQYCSFDSDDHKRLYDCLKTIKGKFILTYNDCEFVRSLYREYTFRRVSRSNSLPSKTESRTEYKEVIITNY